jgi:RNA polymerase sigma-70 factor, ECF subfamily
VIDTDCSRIFALLSEYLDQELPPGTCEDLKRHLDGCPPCLRFVQSLRRSVRLCNALGKPCSLPPISPKITDALREAYQDMLARRSS